MNSGLPIPLESIPIFWRTLSVSWPVINRPPPEDDDDDDDDDDDASFQNDIRQFTDKVSKASPFVRKNMITKLKEIMHPESVATKEPAVKINTRGRPSAKDQKGKASQVPDLNDFPT